MVEAALRAAAPYLSAAEFWGSTPYNVALLVKERVLAARSMAFIGGWSAEYCARQQSLSGPQGYIDDIFGGKVADMSAAQAEAELTRWAAGWGLTVEDCEGEA